MTIDSTRGLHRINPDDLARSRMIEFQRAREAAGSDASTIFCVGVLVELARVVSEDTWQRALDGARAAYKAIEKARPYAGV